MLLSLRGTLAGSLFFGLLLSPSVIAAPYSGHGAGSVSEAVLKKYAPPKLEEVLSRTIQSMLDIRSPGLGVLTPDAARIYFGWRVTGTPQIWTITGPLGFPAQMTGGEDATSLSDVTPDGKFLLISRDRKGEENPGLYYQNAAGGPLVEIQHKPGVQTFLLHVTDDSRWIYFGSNDIQPDSYAIYRFDLAEKKRELVFDQPGIWQLSDFRSEDELLLSKAMGALWREYYTYNPKSKTLTPVLGQNEQMEYVVQFSKHDGEYVVLTPKFGDFRRLYRYKDGHFDPVTPEQNRDVSGFSIDRKRTRITLEINDGGYTRAGALDADDYEPIELSLPKADHVYFGFTTPDGRYSTLGIETGKEPRSTYVYDWKKNEITRWLLPSAPETDLTRFAEVKLEHYPARDGTQIPMFVRRPRECETKLCPVVVHFHGGPEGQSVPGFSTFGQLFVDAGFVYVEPNVRGSDGYGKNWLDADNGPKRLAVITDIEDCAKFIREKWAHDGKAPKVGVMGWSYGGYSTLYAMSRFAGAYDAGVALVGMSDLGSFLKNTAPYRRALRVTEYGDPDKDANALKELSPITYIDRIKSPLLIIQGVSDPRVPAGEAIQIHEALTKRKIASGLILFADEGHGTIKRDNKALEIGHTLGFFEKHLK